MLSTLDMWKRTGSTASGRLLVRSPKSVRQRSGKVTFFPLLTPRGILRDLFVEDGYHAREHERIILVLTLESPHIGRAES